MIHLFLLFSLTSSPVVALKGTGRYSIYVANYASGNIGRHALLEMDEAASDITKGVIALSDVAVKAGVNKFTGQESCWRTEACDVLKLVERVEALKVCVSCRWSWCGGWTDPEPVAV